MNHSPFWPLVWKEYRAGRAFWLALAAMGLVAQGGVRWLAHHPTDRDWWLYGIALMISAAFAVGIGGTSFAAEHEDRTIALLRRLPVRARELGAAKMLSALAGLVALVAVLWFAARAMAGGQSLPAIQADRLWSLWGLACLEGLAWGILYSLLIRHPLRATVAAALTTAFVDSIAVLLAERHDFSATSYADSIPPRTALLVLIVLVDAALLPWWLAGRFPRLRHWQQWSPVTRVADSTWRRPVLHLAWQTFREGRVSFLLLICAAPAAIVLVRRLFQVVIDAPLGDSLSARNFGGAFAMLNALGLLAAVEGALVFRADQRHGPRFLAEQGVSPHTVWFSRQLVWGSWLWALMAIVVLSFVAVFVLSVFSWASGAWLPIDQHNPNISVSAFRAIFAGFNWIFRASWLLCQLLLPAYAAGQLASLLVRRGLLSVTFGLVLGALVSYWVWSMWAIGASWWWSVLPLPVGMLLATWLRLPSWLVERSNPRVWIAPAAAALVPVAVLLIAAPAYRVLQIPAASPVWIRPLSAPTAVADAQGTLELYTKAWDLYLATREETPETPTDNADPSTASPSDQAWRKPVVDLVIEASQRNFSLLALPVPERRAAAKKIEDLSNFIVISAQEEEKAGQLDAALDAYLATLALQTQFHECCGNCPADYERTFRELRRWSAVPDQTAELIQKALRRLNECHAALPTPDARLLPEYEEALLTINDLEAAAAADLVPAKKLEAGDWITSRIPSERARARRMVDWLVSYQLKVARSVVGELAEQKPIEQIAATRAVWMNGRKFTAASTYTVWINGTKYELPRESAGEGSSPDDLGDFVRTYLLTTPLVQHSTLVTQPIAWLLVREETDYRATVIILALNAWKTAHGQLPERLEELVGSEFDKLPLDPLFALPFEYYPHGTPVQNAVRINAPSASAPGPQTPGVFYKDPATRQLLVTDVPILWSALGSTYGEQSVGLLPPKTGAAQADFPYGLIAGGEVRPFTIGRVLNAGTAYTISPSPKEKP